MMAIGLGFTADKVISAYENNAIEELYEDAKRQIEIEKLYHDLCSELVYNNTKQK